MRIIRFIFPLLFIGCQGNISLDNVPLDSYFHDNSSKVWMIDVVKEDGKDLSLDNQNFKDAVIFYKSGRIQIQPINTLGNRSGKKGYFFLQDNSEKLSFDFKDEKWTFTLNELGDYRIGLTPTQDSDNQYYLELIPLPEL